MILLSKEAIWTVVWLLFRILNLVLADLKKQKTKKPTIEENNKKIQKLIKKNFY